MQKIFILLSLIYLISCKLDCGSSEYAESNYDCFNRTVENEDENHCCYLKISDSSGFLGMCIEYSKNVSLDDLRKLLTNVYANNEFAKFEDIQCPSNEDSTKENEDQTKGDETNKEDDKNLCNNYLSMPSESNDCFNRNLEDKENNFCCFIKLLSSEYGSQNICNEFPITNLDILKQSLISQAAEMNMTLEELHCPTNEGDDSPKEYHCSDQASVNDKRECFNRTLSDENEKYCCYYKISGSFGTSTGCNEYPKAYSEEYLRNINSVEYAKAEITLDEFSCPGNG